MSRTIKDHKGVEERPKKRKGHVKLKAYDKNKDRVFKIEKEDYV